MRRSVEMRNKRDSGAVDQMICFLKLNYIFIIKVYNISLCNGVAKAKGGEKIKTLTFDNEYPHKCESQA